ncbi:SDR family oxidoreductase [Streptomyces iconiensis]|uniref:SDR family oxidoreductase n=1 Tax=Streptomyces iconiensis TaxID=1384038 RepID=A0ABT7A0A0_9ACTN|nr:SDR family oxidoreductase [Streptomyces iconiensis]MDJ1134261.1 SDR family oxidoreductase [Streptomyces iconiensis]
MLLTGATGFLGCRLLRELLARGEESVTVLGRGMAEELRARVEAAVRWLDTPPLAPEALGTVRYVSGDLLRPGLDLGPEERARIAEGLTTLWHCAALPRLEGDPAPLHHANVIGTRRVLDLADEAPDARLLHVSTAYVAGRRSTGHITEDDLRDTDGFQLPYEESKYTAERMLRVWAQGNSRDVTVFRPSLLVTDRPVPQGLPGQPTDLLLRLVEQIMSSRAAAGSSPPTPPGGRRGEEETRAAPFLYRLQGDPQASLNLLQADYAAHAMVLAACRARPSTGVRTLHVTHPHNVEFATVAAAVEARFPGLKVSMKPTLPQPTALEKLAANFAANPLAYSTHRRTYDRSHLLTAVGDLPDPEPVDHAYLTRAFGRAPATVT